MILSSVCSALYRRLQRAIVVACSRSAVNQDGSSGNKCALAAHQQLCHIGDLIRCARTSSRTLCEHILVEIPAQAIELVQGQRSHYDARDRKSVV